MLRNLEIQINIWPSDSCIMFYLHMQAGKCKQAAFSHCLFSSLISKKAPECISVIHL